MAVDGWQLVLCRKLYESRAVKSGECIRKDDQPVGTRTSHGVECTLEFVGVPYFQGLEAHAQRRRCGFYDAQVGMQECAGRIPRDTVGTSSMSNCACLAVMSGLASKAIPVTFPPGTRKALDKPLANGIACVCKNDWD